MLHRHVFPMLLASIIILLFASPAIAAKPTTRTSQGSYVIADACDFAIRGDYVERIMVMRKVNDAGTVTTAQFHIMWEGTLTNMETGKTVRDESHYTVFRDFEAGTTTWVGSVYRITLPKQGIVVIDAGKIVFDDATGDILFEAGPHDVLAGGYESLCPALTES